MRFTYLRFIYLYFLFIFYISSLRPLSITYDSCACIFTAVAVIATNYMNKLGRFFFLSLSTRYKTIVYLMAQCTTIHNRFTHCCMFLNVYAADTRERKSSCSVVILIVDDQQASQRSGRRYKCEVDERKSSLLLRFIFNFVSNEIETFLRLSCANKKRVSGEVLKISRFAL